jgi:hypothetical protein
VSLLPKTATALFFDEIRSEADNKQSFMGYYGGHLHLIDPARMPVDRLAVFVTAKWDFDAVPDSAIVEVAVSGQERMEVLLSLSESPPIQGILSPFAGMLASLPLNLRIAPLQPDDTIEVWIVVGDERMPVGRLTVHAREFPPADVKLAIKT